MITGDLNPSTFRTVEFAAASRSRTETFAAAAVDGQGAAPAAAAAETHPRRVIFIGVFLSRLLTSSPNARARRLYLTLESAEHCFYELSRSSRQSVNTFRIPGPRHQ